MFKDKLIQIRKENNDTQEGLGLKINVSRSLIAKWEQGRAYPSYEDIERIAQAYSVDVDKLLTKDELRELYGVARKDAFKKKLLITSICAATVLVVASVPFITIGLIYNNPHELTKTAQFTKVIEENNNYNFYIVDGSTISVDKKYLENQIKLGSIDIDLTKNDYSGVLQRKMQRLTNAYGNRKEIINSASVSFDMPSFSKEKTVQGFAIPLDKNLSVADFNSNNTLFIKSIDAYENGNLIGYTFEGNNSYLLKRKVSYYDWVETVFSINYDIIKNNYHYSFENFNKIDLPIYSIQNNQYRNTFYNPISDYEQKNVLDFWAKENKSTYSKNWTYDSFNISMQVTTIDSLTNECGLTGFAIYFNNRDVVSYTVIEYSDNEGSVSSKIKETIISSKEDFDNFSFDVNSVSCCVETDKQTDYEDEIQFLERGKEFSVEFPNEFGIFEKYTKTF